MAPSKLKRQRSTLGEVSLTSIEPSPKKATKSPYTSQQKAAINDFVGFTSSDRTQAAKILKQYNWNLTTAVESYFKGPAGYGAPSTSALGAIFDKYKKMGEDGENMDLTSTQAWFKDIGVSLEDATSFLALAVSGCETIGEIKKDKFIAGWTARKCDSIPKQKQFITVNKNTLGSAQNETNMELTYKGTFPLLLQSGQRSAEKGACIDSWRTLFTAPCLDWSTPNFNWLETWIKFVEESKGVKGISKDQWAHVLKFAKLSLGDESLGFHNDEQSWPALIDEFVDYVKAIRGDEAPKGDVEMEY